jgi:hypothetical protein
MTPADLIRDGLLAGINFEKIHAYMTAVNWTYGFDKTVPSIEELIKTADHVLGNVISSPLDNSSSSTGGFHAFKHTWGSNNVEYEIMFAIEDAHQNVRG